MNHQGFSTNFGGGFPETNPFFPPSLNDCLPGTSGFHCNTPLQINGGLEFLNDPQSVRTELKKAITVKKIAKGEEIPKVEYKEPPPPQRRPPEKPEDLKKKREKNKLAAMKCRKKKRERKENYYRIIQKWEEWNSKIARQNSQLRAEKAHLEQILMQHMCLQQEPQLVDSPESPLTDLSTLLQQEPELIDGSPFGFSFGGL